MIDRRQLRDWLEAALRFANGPPPDTEGQRVAILGGRDLSVPAELFGGTKKLWKDWHRWLKEFQEGDANRDRLRTWCLAQCVDYDNPYAWNISTREFEAPITFDEDGRPQMLLEATSLQGMLAVVGVELLAPAPPFTVATCKREGCENLIVKTLLRHRSDGRPMEYCVIAGQSHALTVAERLRDLKRKRVAEATKQRRRRKTP